MMKIAGMKKALAATNITPGKIDKEIYTLNQQLLDIEQKLYGNKSKHEIGEKNNPLL